MKAHLFFLGSRFFLLTNSILLNIVWETLMKIIGLTSIYLRSGFLLLLQLLRKCIDLWLRNFACDIPLWEDGTTYHLNDTKMK